MQPVKFLNIAKPIGMLLSRELNMTLHSCVEEQSPETFKVRFGGFDSSNLIAFVTFNDVEYTGSFLLQFTSSRHLPIVILNFIIGKFSYEIVIDGSDPANWCSGTFEKRLVVEKDFISVGDVTRSCGEIQVQDHSQIENFLNQNVSLLKNKIRLETESGLVFTVEFGVTENGKYQAKVFRSGFTTVTSVDIVMTGQLYVTVVIRLNDEKISINICHCQPIFGSISSKLLLEAIKGEFVY